MRKIRNAALAACLYVVPLFAGSMMLQVANPAADPEAIAKNAVVVARITACESPERTTVTATAEGMLHGKRRSLPLQVVNLAAPGAFAIAGQWPKEGSWAVQIVATNPVYKNYAAAAVVPLRGHLPDWSAVRHIFHAPTPAEIDSVLAQNSI